MSILGLWEPLISFEYGLASGSFTTESYIFPDELAFPSRHSSRLAESGRFTVVVQDNSSVHTSLQVQAKWPQWQEKGLYLFFLPKYCSQIAPLARQTHELAGRMFEDEYDLALAVMEGVEHRGQQGEYSTERFKFNSS